MTLKVTINFASDFSKFGPTIFYATDKDSVIVGRSGELRVISVFDRDNNPVEFRIYAPGTWAEVNTEWHDEDCQ